MSRREARHLNLDLTVADIDRIVGHWNSGAVVGWLAKTYKVSGFRVIDILKTDRRAKWPSERTGASAIAATARR